MLLRSVALVCHTLAWNHSFGVKPYVQIRTAIDYLTAKFVVSWPASLVPPLCQLVATPQKIKFWIAKNVATVVFKEV